MELTGKQRIILAIIAAAIMLTDNVTTLLAIGSGAVEKNPVVEFFLRDIRLYIVFTAIKVNIAAILTSAYVRTTKELLYWSIIMLIFIRAIYINLVNWWNG